MTASKYLLDNAAEHAAGRFAALADLFDATTARHLEVIGVGPGWRCWEVGAGNMSVSALLHRRVGPRGQVLATDLDLRWLDQRAPWVQVRRHDVALDDPLDADGPGFDLVHARLVLSHVPDRGEALRRMVAALRPGGWLLLEDFDTSMQPQICPEHRRPVEHRANRIRDGFLHLLADRGVDLEYGRKLPRLLRTAGLRDVAADAYFPLALPAAAELEIANLRQVRTALLACGFTTAAEVDAHLAALADCRIDAATPPLVSAWGRRAA